MSEYTFKLPDLGEGTVDAEIAEMTNLLVGADLGPRLSVALLLLGANLEASVGYGAFSLFGAGGDLRWTFPALRDSQGVERVHLYLHGRGAWFTTDPHGLFGNTDLLAAGGLGVEYYTRLRHFSVGVMADRIYASGRKRPVSPWCPRFGSASSRFLPPHRASVYLFRAVLGGGYEAP